MSSAVIANMRPTVATTTTPVVQGPGANIHVISALPEGFPKTLDNQLVWSGSTLKESDYVTQLTKSDITELEAALKHFKDLELDGDDVNRETFPLVSLATKLDTLRRDVYHGRGFVLIRGLDLNKYTTEDSTIIYLGVQSYIANERGRQDRTGNMLVHIKAYESNEVCMKHHRHSAEAITFHTEESCDAVGWLTRDTAITGGKCIIASAYTVYNRIAATRPDLIRTLAKGDWPFAFPKFHCRPIIFNEGGRLITNFGRAPLIGNVIHPRPSSMPSINQQQMEALNAIERVAKETQLEFQTRRGDIHFINNMAVLHRREAFTDGSHRRHLVRTWLRNSEDGWEIPRPLASDFKKTFDDKLLRVYHPVPLPALFDSAILRTHTN